MDIKLKYDVNGRETERKFSNGVSQNTYYDKAGRVILMTQKTSGNEITWGEAYLYGADGKRTATADINGAVTLYEYDIKGQLTTVYYPYTKAMEDALKEEAEENRMPTVAECGINKYLDTGTRNGLSALLNRISWNYGSKILAMQLFIKESYKYDGNGNRIQKITPYGTIDYTYNEENFLISSGWNGNVGVTYTYDKNGNLLIQESELKTVKYAYNSMNRIMYSEVTDKKEKTHSVSYYGYDAFGRRILEQDKDEAALRSLYDGFTFDVVKQSPTFTNGLFVDSNETGIRINITGRPTGDRYRYLEDNVQQDGNRYFHLDEGNYRNVSARYKGSRTTLSVNGTIAAQNADGEISYFTTDLLGSVRTTTDGYGYVDKNYSYDAFGAIIEGDLSGRQNFGYLGKQFDSQTGLYNYGYRDYTPKVARFTAVDPIRDGANWLTYCRNDAVNHIDLWGLSVNDANSNLAFYSEDPDYLNLKIDEATAKKILETSKKHLSDEYIKATKDNGWYEFRCDNFDETVINESGYKSSNYLAGSATGTSVDKHIDWALKNGLTKKVTKNAKGGAAGGAYVVYMGDGQFNNGEHADSHSGLIVFDKKNVLFIDNSSGNKNEVHPNGGVAIHRYDSVLDFQLDYGGTYSSFYYLKINGQ